MNEGMAPQDVDSFAISRNPRANLSRKVLSPSCASKPQAALVPGRVRNSLRASGSAKRLADELGLEPECVTERMPNGET